MVSLYFNSLILNTRFSRPKAYLDAFNFAKSTLNDSNTLYAATDGSHLILGEETTQPRTSVSVVTFRTPTLEILESKGLEFGREVVQGIPCISLNPPWCPSLTILVLESSQPVCYMPCATTTPPINGASSQIKTIDHIAIAVEKDVLQTATEWFREYLDFARLEAEDLNGVVIRQGDSGMRLMTIRKDNFYIALVEPIDGATGQVYEFVEVHGNGVQHIAFQPVDLLNVSSTRLVDFDIPTADVWKSIIESTKDESLKKLITMRKEKGILVNIRPYPCGDYGMLSQIFTRMIAEDAQIFFELIDRKNYEGFATQNIQGLFQAKQEENDSGQ